MAEHADTTRWQGYTHDDLYRLLHEGAGPAASAEPSRRWAAIAATLHEVGQDLRAAIGQSGSGWTGRAAGRAYDSLAGLVDWAQQTAAHAADMRRLVEEQAEFLARARSEMPVPDGATPAATDPTMAPAAQVIASQQDKEPVEAATAAGAQRAFEVMAAYQRDTTATTSAMASFSAPAEIAGGNDVHRNQRMGVQGTTPSLAGGPVLPPPQRDHDRGHGRQHGESRGWGGGGGTWGAAARVDLPRRPAPERGTFTVAAPVNEPIIGAAPPGSSGGNQSSNRTGGGRGGRGSVPSTPGVTGSPTLGGSGTVPGSGPRAFDLDLQSAAAGQAVVAPGTPAAATPGVAAGTNSSAAGGSADRAGLRRFGVETIGSGQWFGDGPEAEVRGSSPARGRWSSREDERLTEQVSIDGEEHNLPPNVIGEGR